MDADPRNDFVLTLVKSFRFEDATLPALPDAVIYLQKALDDDSISMAALAAVLEKDPVLAMRIISVANSSLYRTVQPAENVSDAVMRVGLSTTRNVSLVSLRNAFQARHPLIGARIGQLWKESLHVAAIAATLAQHARIADPNRAMLGGLLCNVGPMLLLTAVDGKLESVDRERTVDHLLDTYGARFGKRLLRHWGMDPELVDVAAHSNDPQRQNALGADLADLIIVARLCQALNPTESQEEDDLSRLSSCPAFGRVMARSTGDTPLAEILDAAAERIDETFALLAA